MRNSASRAVASGAAVSLFCFVVEEKKSNNSRSDRRCQKGISYPSI